MSGNFGLLLCKRIAEGSGAPAEALLALANDIEDLLKERDEWKAKAEQWEKEGIRLLHMLERHSDTENMADFAHYVDQQSTFGDKS